MFHVLLPHWFPALRRTHQHAHAHNELCMAEGSLKMHPCQQRQHENIPTIYQTSLATATLLPVLCRASEWTFT